MQRVIVQETQAKLVKLAQSYGLFTFETINTLNKNLKEISNITRDELPKNIISPFTSIELIPIKGSRAEGFNNRYDTKLNYYHDEENNLSFRLEKLHEHNNNSYVLRASFIIDSLLNSESTNLFNEPTCILSDTGSILFCSEQDNLKNASNIITETLKNTDKRVFDIEYGNETYTLAEWELFLPTYLQSETWHFVIIKKQSQLLAAIIKFQTVIIPIALLFFTVASYAIYRFINTLMNPLDQLSLATKKIAQGNHDIHFSISTNDEFKELSESFSSMSTSLLNQYNKDQVFSNLEQSILLSTDIHSAL